MRHVENLRYALAAVRRHIALAIWVFCGACLVGVALTILLPPKYSSSMLILIRPTPTDLINTPDRANGLTIGQVSEEEVNSEVGLLTSESILRRAVLDNHLDHRGLFGRQTEKSNVDAAVQRLAKSLNVTAVRKADIIEVEYSADSPRLAASVLRTIRASYMALHEEAQSTPAAQAFFEQQTAYYKDQFTQEQAALATFSQRNHVGNLDQRRSLLTRAISDQQIALQQTDASIAELQTEVDESRRILRTLSARIQTVASSGANEYSVDHLTALLADLENRRIQQSSKFKDNDPFVEETDAEIAKTREALRQASSPKALQQSTDVNPVEQNIEGGAETKSIELDGLKSKRAVLQRDLSANQEVLNRLIAAEGAYDMLDSTTQDMRADYNDYLKRAEAARVANALDRKGITNVVTAQEPTESTIASASHRGVNLLLTVLFALFASAAAVAAAEILQDEPQSTLT